jgi:hypothetical protein
MLTVTGLLSWLKALDVFRLGTITTGGKMNPSEFVLYEMNFGCVDVWEFNSEGRDRVG